MEAEPVRRQLDAGDRAGGVHIEHPGHQQRGRLTADVRITSLQQWGEIQSQLASVSNVTGVTVLAMDMSYARIQLGYQGGADQLREALSGAGLALTSRGGGQWILASTR